MGWQDRDYAEQTWHEQSSAGPRLRWPSRGAAILIILHIVACVFLLLIEEEQGGEAIISMLALSDTSAHPLAVLLHPLATRAFLTLIITVVVIWSLAGRIEQQFGFGRMLGLYVVGNLLAGGAFFAVARTWPALAGVALDYPTGAFAAWCVAVFRGLSGEIMMLFGRPRRVSHVVALAAVVIVGLLLALHRLAGVGWLVALLAGGVAEPLVRRMPALPTLTRRPARRRRVRPSVPREPRRRPTPGEPNVDDILAKISRDGLDSLTPEERDRLEAARQAKLRQSRDVNATR